ncbi:leucine-rich repeat extensin-like protein 2-like [Populus alba x Populus x berolinensis]|uniref:Leucine-rich repeat extensin-like protein 2-like n=1 Tax=Populus alba x Populus x berolinensis TaxID=444605 RepID=A0AAD6RF01_9ROSI|nr:leucine-rich repeat extensin-like protein 2-like [Populus alba x Populus x berolinensis]
MCSDGGKIQPRLHDNQLAYIGGDTRILSVDHGIKFSGMVHKVTSLCGGAIDIFFKYQLPVVKMLML